MSQEGFRIFEYTRKEKDSGVAKYKAEIIVKGYDILCYGETVVPPGISEDAALAFFEEAEKAVLKKIDADWENKTGG